MGNEERKTTWTKAGNTVQQDVVGKEQELEWAGSKNRRWAYSNELEPD